MPQIREKLLACLSLTHGAALVMGWLRTMTDQRDPKGRFQPGNPGGPGRQRRRPLRDAITNEDERDLWQRHKDEAQGSGSDARAAREFLLRHLAGNPYQACPEIPPLNWPEVFEVRDLAAAANAVLAAHREGHVDSAGLHFLVDLLVKIAKVFEVADLAPAVRELQEQLAAMRP